MLRTTMAAVKRAEKTELEAVFRKYASVQRGDQWFMSHEDFVCRYLQLADSQAGPQTIRLLADMADTTKDKLISFVEFQSFESLLCSADAIHQLAFRMFDLKNRGSISFEDFKHVLSVTTLHSALPFDFNTSFIRRYFGQDRQHQLEYYEFVQLLQSLPTEHARQGFVARDQDKTGTIPALDFVELMKKIRGFRMSSYVQDHLLSVAGGSPAREVSYGYFKAFNQLLGNLDILERIMNATAAAREDGRVTQAQLLREAQSYAQVTPLQISLLFNLCSLEEPSGTISRQDFSRLLPRPPLTTPTAQPVSQDVVEETPTKISPFLQALEPVYRFVLGGMGGAVGATAVYPIDLVKTRLQNQRGSVAGEIMYRNSFDCFRKVLKNEGFFGLYRGLLPQLMGVSPEKAIKLATNDTMRDVLRSKDGSLPLWRECIAGGCGGGAQVFFTNPLEIVKIRLQVAGEMAGGAQVRAWPVVKGLGLFGLYKGASACWLRDIPFSAIYFPTYAHMKVFTADKNGRNGPASLFVSGFIAGVPAAGLVTPADVIKTRLQVVARKGQQTYKGIIDCFRKILRTEGPRAFWKGAPARIFRSSPQFGVTLCTYELLQRLFYVDFGKQTPAKPGFVPSSMPTDTVPFHLPDHIGGFRMAHSTFAAVESRFGLVFPKSVSNQ